MASIAQPVVSNRNVLSDVAVLIVKSVVLLVVCRAHVVIVVICGRIILTLCTKHWKLTFTKLPSSMYRPRPIVHQMIPHPPPLTLQWPIITILLLRTRQLQWIEESSNAHLDWMKGQQQWLVRRRGEGFYSTIANHIWSIYLIYTRPWAKSCVIDGRLSFVDGSKLFIIKNNQEGICTIIQVDDDNDINRIQK